MDVFASSRLPRCFGLDYSTRIRLHSSLVHALGKMQLEKQSSHLQQNDSIGDCSLLIFAYHHNTDHVNSQKALVAKCPPSGSVANPSRLSPTLQRDFNSNGYHYGACCFSGLLLRRTVQCCSFSINLFDTNSRSFSRHYFSNNR